MRIAERSDDDDIFWRTVFGRTGIDCKKEQVVTEVILHPLETDQQIAQRARCTVRTVKKWRPYAGRYVVAVKTDAGTLRVRLRAPEGVRH